MTRRKFECNSREAQQFTLCNVEFLQESAGTTSRNTTKAAAPSSVCAVQCAQTVRAIPESATNSSGSSAIAPLNPDLDSSDYSGSSSRDGRTAVARYCCFGSHMRRRRLNSSSSSAAGHGARSRTDSTRLAKRRQADASARRFRAQKSGESSCARLGLRQRTGVGGSGSETQAASSRQSVRNFKVNVRCAASELSCGLAHAGTEDASTETTQKASSACVANVQEPRGKSWPVRGKSCSGPSASSKASFVGPNGRADLDSSAHSSREGCARESLAQSCELSARGPSKFKAFACSFACKPREALGETRLHASALASDQLQCPMEPPVASGSHLLTQSTAADVLRRQDSTTRYTTISGKRPAGIQDEQRKCELARRPRRTTRDVTSGEVEKWDVLETIRDNTRDDESNFTLERCMTRRRESTKACSGQAICAARASGPGAGDLDKRALGGPQPLGAAEEAAQFSIDIELGNERTKRTGSWCAEDARKCTRADALICENSARACETVRHDNTSCRRSALHSRRAKGVAHCQCCCFSSDAIHLLATSGRNCAAHGLRKNTGAPPPDFRVTRVIGDKLVLPLAGGGKEDDEDDDEAKVWSTFARCEAQVRRCTSQLEVATDRYKASASLLCGPLLLEQKLLRVRSVLLRARHPEGGQVNCSRSAGNFTCLVCNRDERERGRRRRRSSLSEFSVYSDILRLSQSNSYQTAPSSKSLYHQCKSTFSTSTTCDKFSTCSPDTTTCTGGEQSTSQTFRTAGHEWASSETLHSEAGRTWPPDTPTNMVSFVELADAVVANTESTNSDRAAANAPEIMDDEDIGELRLGEDDQASSSSDTASRLKRHQQQKTQQGAVQPPRQLLTSLELDDDDDLVDEEQLKRILACKRLSEGNNGQSMASQNHQQRLPSSAASHLGSVCRKNSLHMIGESLPPVTEGVPVRHHHHHLSSANMGDQGVVSGSLRTKTGQLAGKRNSQDDNTASCSSSTSLDGSSGGGSGGSGLSRRRSSTVSQCSSVLSEGTRQQLNFDLSPDLPPDSSILEANAISPVDFERPASPEPSSEPLDSNEECSFDMRPISRMSGTFCSSGAGDDEIMLTADSPDSTLGDSNKETQTDRAADELVDSSGLEANFSEQHQHEVNIRDNLERIISHVSTVRVSGASDAIAREPHEEMGVSAAGQKRAHTPFGLNIQRNKTTHMSPATPSPTAHLSETPASAKVSATCE